MNEFLEQFVLESRELAELAVSEMLALEKDPGNRDHLDSAFRAFHTLKGGAGIVDFMAMSRAVHAAEDALSGIRSGQHSIDARLIGDCLSCLDQVAVWLQEIETTGEVPASADVTAEAIVRRFAEATALEQETESVSAPAALVPPIDADGWPLVLALLEEQAALVDLPAIEGRDGRWSSAARLSANVLRYAARPDDAAAVERALDASRQADDAAALVQAIRRIVDGPDDGERALDATSSRADAATRTLRIDAAHVDDLVSLTGELTVVKNAIAHIAKQAIENGDTSANALKDEHSRFDRLIGNLQHAVLNLRVLPLRIVFQRFARTVRELSLELDKPIDLEIEGEATVADKVIVEVLFEPLLHVVRNAADHGIETQAERIASGKPNTATIRLSARRAGENVVVEVSDDGRGIDRAKVRQIAVERALVEQDAADAMTDDQVDDLLFAPGFSTAAEVTDLSGRGVGLNAVRSTVEQIGGRVSIESSYGYGSTVRFMLPFSIMMTRVMTVEADGQMFGIPLDAVIETIRLPRERIQTIGSAGAFVLRDQTIPLIDLAQTLGHERINRPGKEAICVITSVLGQFSALEVDRLGERVDVMLKPIDGLLTGAIGIAGTTLTGDGQVLLILDLQDLLF
jgi:two-component system chemotaxis sensor kinase CheA